MYNMPEAAKPPFYQRYLVQRVSSPVEQLYIRYRTILSQIASSDWFLKTRPIFWHGIDILID